VRRTRHDLCGSLRPEWLIEAAAHLTILSESEPPDVIVRAIGLEPDQKRSNGDPLRAGGKRPYNGLEYASGLDAKQRPETHLAVLMQHLRRYVGGIVEVSSWPTTHNVRVTVVEHTLDENPELCAQPGDLAVIASMKAELFFDAYVYCDGPNELI
jgi:Domain of unknown function (DUF4279)